MGMGSATVGVFEVGSVVVGAVRSTVERRPIAGITSATWEASDARTLLEYVRGHWGIENRLHWSLDVTFREDTLRNRLGHSAENFSRIRRLALNLLRYDKTCKAGIKGKRLQACLKEDYLLGLLREGIWMRLLSLAPDPSSSSPRIGLPAGLVREAHSPGSAT